MDLGQSIGAITYLFSSRGVFPEIEADHKISDIREILREL